MNWISNVVRPRIRSFLSTKREVPDNLWVQCPESGQMVFHKDLEANAFVVPGSDHHMRMSAQDRLAYTFDDGAYEAVPVPAVPVDPLKFRDGRRYVDRLRDAKSKVELEDAVVIGEGMIQGSAAVVAVQDFRFMGGSLGMAAGEAVIAAIERALSSTVPFILFAASGGARMQEGILSLMQMPRTTIAVQRLREAGLPYIVVLTDPTTGGVTASYAMLGDVQIAEPGALICFAGPRVIEQTIREQLPEGFQRAEYLLEHGMIDMVVHRHKMRQTLGRLCRVLAPARESDATVAEVGEDALSPALNGLANDALVAPETMADAEPVADSTAEGQDMAVSGEARLDAPTDPAVKSAITDAPADPDQPELPLAPGDAAAELEKPAPAPAESGLLSSLGFATSIIGSQAKPEPKEPKDDAEPAAEARAPKTKASKSKSAKHRAGGDQSE